MPVQLSRRDVFRLAAGAGTLALTGCGGRSTQTIQANGLPGQLVWSTYNVGTGTYNDLAAVATTLTGREGTQVRLMTSDSGIGRLAPLVSGIAHYARAGDEYYYAFEGVDEFASPQWGPQPIRQVWTPPGNYGVLVRRDSGIEKVADLRGKRYPDLTASTSMNRKLEAILNFGGLTGTDVVKVPISYGEQIDGLRAGQLDAMYQNVVGSNVEELASQYPIRWLDLSSEDRSRYATWEELAPMVRPGQFADGAGMAPGETAVNMQYSIPLTAMADTPAEQVHALCRAIGTNFEHFKSATPDAKRFDPQAVLMEPLVVPFHEGAVRFFTEIGRWNPQLQTRNQALLERGRLMREAWPGVLADHPGDGLPAAWRTWKTDNLPPLPAAGDEGAAS